MWILAYVGGFTIPIHLVNNQILKATTSHGISYENGVIYAPTGPNGIILAIDANKEKIIIWPIYYIVQFKVPR